jgi:hypothetical protein
MTVMSASPLDADPDAGAARTLIVRLRREPGSDHWRGQAICVQTGATMTISLVLDNDNATQLAAALQQLLGKPSDASLMIAD